MSDRTIVFRLTGVAHFLSEFLSILFELAGFPAIRGPGVRNLKRKMAIAADWLW